MVMIDDLLRRAVAEPNVVPVGVARPRDALRDDVAGLLVRVLLEEVDLAERNEENDLEPSRRWQRRPRADGTYYSEESRHAIRWTLSMEQNNLQKTIRRDLMFQSLSCLLLNQLARECEEENAYNNAETHTLEELFCSVSAMISAKSVLCANLIVDHRGGPRT